MRSRAILWSLALCVSCLAEVQAAGKGERVRFETTDGRVEIFVEGTRFATYVYEDEKTLRPYFANVQAPGGIRVTRKHPADEKAEGGDHSTMHPGIWLAFGDISGADFWRNRAQVTHAGFQEKPQMDREGGRFTVRNEYRAQDRLICRETCAYTVRPVEQGILLTSDSTFENPEAPFTFGDQEELGMGARVNRALRVKGGNGRILNAEGKVNEKQVWGQASDWCDYSGTIDGSYVGMTLMPHPQNFRPSWFHVRDYGLMLANPFGRKALTGGEKSAVTVKPGESLRLRFAVLTHAEKNAENFDPSAVYRVYINAD